MAHPEVDALIRQFPLSEGWSFPECFSESVQIGRCRLSLVGLVAHRLGQTAIDACGSAARSGPYPYDRAYYELLERTCMYDALEASDAKVSILGSDRRVLDTRSASAVFPRSPPGCEWEYARSNGVAVGRTWSAACRRAHHELIERHRVLWAWFGATNPESVNLPDDAAIRDLDSQFVFEAYRFIDPGEGLPNGLGVVGVFAFPRSASHPLAYGFAADQGYELASRRALGECVQRLGFLWGEPLPSHAPRFEPTSAYHQDVYLYPANHGRLRSWLKTGHAKKVSVCATPRLRLLGYVDLTPDHLLGRICVAKAHAETELPLTFGRGYPLIMAAEAEVDVHPIA